MSDWEGYARVLAERFDYVNTFYHADPRLDQADVVALNMTNNTFAWKFHSKANTYGGCRQGTISTAGNLVFTSFDGRQDLTNAALLAQGITPGPAFVALDATRSRQPMCDLAQGLQAQMFQAAADLGGLDVQLVYYRGFSECRASPFVSGGQGLAALMSKIDVRGGVTQIEIGAALAVAGVAHHLPAGLGRRVGRGARPRQRRRGHLRLGRRIDLGGAAVGADVVRNVGAAWRCRSGVSRLGLTGASAHAEQYAAHQGP